MNEVKQKFAERKRENQIAIIADHYGAEHQIEKLCEELFECGTAAKHIGRNQIGSRDCLISELADVHILTQQLLHLMDCEDEFVSMVNFKLERQIKRISEE